MADFLLLGAFVVPASMSTSDDVLEAASVDSDVVAIDQDDSNTELYTSVNWKTF